jgi:hypothetical protein
MLSFIRRYHDKLNAQQYKYIFVHSLNDIVVSFLPFSRNKSLFFLIKDVRIDCFML